MSSDHTLSGADLDRAKAHASRMYANCIRKSINQLSTAASFVQSSANKKGLEAISTAMQEIRNRVSSRAINGASILKAANLEVMKAADECGCGVWVSSVIRSEELMAEVEYIARMRGASVNENGFSILTEPMELTDEELDVSVPVGPFLIELRTDLSYFVHPAPDCPNLSCDGYWHPNVNRSGNPCLGNLVPTVGMSLASGNFSLFVITMEQYLRTYNPYDRYRSLENWKGVPCGSCGAVSNTASSRGFPSCHRCGTRVCGECEFTCPACGAVRCQACHDECACHPSCEHDACVACVASCMVCGRETCRNCHIACAACATVVCLDHAKRCCHCDCLVCPEHIERFDGQDWCHNCTFVCQKCGERKTNTSFAKRTAACSCKICDQCSPRCADCLAAVCEHRVCAKCHCPLCPSCACGNLCSQCSGRWRKP